MKFPTYIPTYAMVLALICAGVGFENNAQAVLDQAPEGVWFGDPEMGGSGCSETTAKSVLSTDRKQLSILFNKYSVEAGSRVARNVDHKSCNLRVPVSIPNGYIMTIFKVDYRGFNSLPMEARSEFEVEYFFAGNHGPTFKEAFRGPKIESFTISNDVQIQGVVWSRCGENPIFSINTGLTVQADPRSVIEAKASVDTVDIADTLVYHFQFNSCDPRQPPPGPGPGPGPINPPFPPPPGPVASPCKIDSDPFNSGYYFVRDMHLDQIGHVFGYDAALRLALAEANGRCLGSGSIRPWPPMPPVPPPPPPPVQKNCSIEQDLRNPAYYIIWDVHHQFIQHAFGRQEAEMLAEAWNFSRCLGAAPPPPPPRPVPNYSCTIHVRGRVYLAEGFSTKECADNARSICLINLGSESICKQGVIKFNR